MPALQGPLSGTTLKQYRILEQIGAGGMGVVYRAHDERLQRDVAIKVLVKGSLGDVDAQKRAREEALALSKLNHPNITTIFDFDQLNGVDFVVLELIPGVSLDTKLAGEKLSTEEIVDLGVQLAHGLAAAHEHHVIHCDLKPGNIRITPDGRLKILDFGLARAAHQLPDTTGTRTTASNAFGTLPYMAPEQLRGHRLDGRTDIWAAGCVLYEMATGKAPFQGDTGPVLSAAILTETPPPPSSANPKISPALEMIILKCLERDPDARYQSAKELAADLHRSTMMSGRFATIQSPRRGLLRMAANIAVAAVLLLALWRAPQLWRSMFPAAATRIESIAVLPLDNLSRDPQQEYFADGMTDELITRLSNIDNLRVISRTSSMGYRNSTKPLPQIARELNVDAVVEGSVLWSGNRVRISAQLIDGRKDRTLWSDAYERDLKDVLALQSDVARAIAGSIQVQLTPQTQAKLSAGKHVAPEAYQLYLKGRYHWNKRTEEDVNQALSLFQQAIAKEPNYAQAYAAIADCYAVLGAYGLIPADEANGLEFQAAQRAVQLDDQLAEAHAALGSSLADKWDWSGSLKEYERAIKIDRNYATAAQWYAETLMNVGRVDDALREIDRAQQSDPLSLVINSVNGYLRYRAHRYDDAIARLRKAMELDPSFYRTHLYLSGPLEEKKDYKEAVAELRKSMALPGGDIPEARAALGHVYGVSGDKQKGREILGELEHPKDGGFMDPFYLAVVYDGLGDRDAAIKYLQKAYEIRSKALTFQVNDARLHDLRSDPRFLDLLRRMNFPE